MPATTTAPDRRTTNPLLAAFGPGPLAVFAIVRLPEPALRATRPELHDRLHRMARELAAGYGVELGRCGCCGAGIAEHVVGEAGFGPATERPRFVACRDCVRDHGGASLNRKLSFMDKTHEGYAQSLERAARRAG